MSFFQFLHMLTFCAHSLCCNHTTVIPVSFSKSQYAFFFFFFYSNININVCVTCLYTRLKTNLPLFLFFFGHTFWSYLPFLPIINPNASFFPPRNILQTTFTRLSLTCIYFMYVFVQVLPWLLCVGG